jgi:hypothetical protein
LLELRAIHWFVSPRHGVPGAVVDGTIDGAVGGAAAGSLDGAPR